MHRVGNMHRTLIAFVLLAVTESPSATLETVISGVTSSVGMTVTRVPVLVGGEAALPCDTRTSVRNDSLLLVVWYREDNPVYSYDTRIPGPSAHWVEDHYIGRAQWTTPGSALRLSDVRPHDRATYRCRVDFYVAQTRNYKVDLYVIELPSQPVIFDEYGKEIIGIAGPYHEGGEFKLVCTVKGGYPIPRIQWLQGETVLAILKSPTYFTEEFQPSRSLTLTISNATREHLGAIYICSADNTLLAPPRKTPVQIDLYLKPQSAEIISKEQPISVGVNTELSCKTKGARPPATITWWLGGVKMDSVIKSASAEANETESILKWVPRKEHNGQVLTCRVEHAKFNRTIIERKLSLNVYYMPEATIHLGDKMNPNDIEEGDDVYFGCKVDANPAAYKIVWEHNGSILQNNPTSGVIMTGNINLALRNISRMQAGHYTCIASNVEGDGRSPYLLMQVFYKPLCVKEQMKIIGAALEEATNLTCEVDAYPLPSTFQWILNNSAGSHIIDTDQYTVEAKESRSRLTFKPSSDVDYGTLSCRATNLAGQQVVPCVYTLLPASIPDPPRNCTVYNLTDDSLDLGCLAGYEGGLKCTYHAEIWARKILLTNISNDSPTWNFRRLGSNKKLRLIIYAANSRGRSDYVTFTVETTLKISPRTKPQESWESNWEISMFLTAIMTVLLVLCSAAIAVRVRNRNNDYEVSLPTLKNQEAIVQNRNSLQSLDDKNPDLIPLSKGTIEATSVPPQYSTVVPSDQPRQSHSNHSLPRTHTPVIPNASQTHYSDFQSDYGRTVTRSHREIVTTRTPLLGGTIEATSVPPQYSTVVPSDQPRQSHSNHSLPRTHTPVIPNASQTHYSDFQSDYGRTVTRSHREIVTTRTPLLGGHQESCV